MIKVSRNKLCAPAIIPLWNKEEPRAKTENAIRSSITTPSYPMRLKHLPISMPALETMKSVLRPTLWTIRAPVRAAARFHN